MLVGLLFLRLQRERHDGIFAPPGEPVAVDPSANGVLVHRPAGSAEGCGDGNNAASVFDDFFDGLGVHE